MKHSDPQPAGGLIHSVERVEYAFWLRYPPLLHIRAEGRDEGAPGKAELRVRDEERPVADGILELDFVAHSPAPAARQTPARVRAEFIWEEDVYAIRGVRVFARTGSLTKMFGEAEPPG